MDKGEDGSPGRTRGQSTLITVNSVKMYTALSQLYRPLFKGGVVVQSVEHCTSDQQIDGG